MTSLDCASLYIHIPFCIKKCKYCDFYSEVRLEAIPDYVSALLKEIELKLIPGQNLKTIYLGGGTPSLLSISQIRSILETIRGICNIEAEAEISCELNPGTVNYDYLCWLKRSGINRLSIGVQSFNEDKLKFLGRIHSSAEAIKAIDNAIKAGFENISLDLIYGVPKERLPKKALPKTALPEEDLNEWLSDLKKALQFNPSHLSCYMLTIEQGTPLALNMAKNLFEPFSTDIMAEWFKITSQYLSEAGFDHYEISNFSQGRDKRSRHNSAYWNMLPYVGLGAGAHSYDKAVRSWNHNNIYKYIKDIKSGRMPVQEMEILSLDQQMTEMIMLRLRTLEGLDLNAFQKKFNIAFQKRFKNIIEPLIAEKLGKIQKERFFLTPEGRTRLDSIIEAFAFEIFTV